MNDVRIKYTNNEKLAQQVLDANKENLFFNMSEGSVDEIIAGEKANAFNNQVDEYIEKFDKHTEFLKQYAESFNENIGTIEIRPMGVRVLVKPFEYNPFQKVKVDEKSGIILDLGGKPIEDFNTDKGEFQERQQVIIVGSVVEVGPECKFLSPGDCVFYHRGNGLPVPFMKAGLMAVKEENIIAVVNENLSERWK